MISFPTTLRYAGSAIHKFNPTENNTAHANNITKNLLAEIDFTDYTIDNINNGNIKLHTDITDYSESVSGDTAKEKLTTNISRVNNVEPFNMTKYNNAVYEDVYKMPAIALASFNNYKFIYKKSVDGRSGIYNVKGDNENVYTIINHIPGSPSLFNPLFAVNARGFMKGLPLIFRKSDSNISVDTDNSLNITTTNADHFGMNVSDCSIHNLVALSEESIRNGERTTNPMALIMGLSTYRYADFMYCKDLGKCPNNHLITLRKFPYPVGDNIFIGAIARNGQEDESSKFDPTTADCGRLITWFGTEDNKLEDIMSYDMKMSWKDLTAKIEEQDSAEDQSNKPLNSIINSLSPQYNAMQQGGFTKGANIWSLIGSNASGKFGKLMNESGPHDYTTLRNYDQNKVYTPKNTIQDTVLYEGKLTYSQEFTLNFCYKLRAYDNINPKSAFLDLLGNILEVSYRRGQFWGGARKLNGPPQNTSAWKTANAFINNTFDKVGGFLEALFRGNIDFSSILASASEIVGNAYNTAKSAVNGAGGVSAIGQKLADGILNLNKRTGFMNGLKGQLQNALGRPALYAWQSLLSAAPVGLWHVTIGNPLNPIAAFGNMIVTNAKVTHSGPLGIDDFPTELKVSITLKHARSRDVAEISKMYTRGTGSLYNPLANKAINNYINTTSAGNKRLKNAEIETLNASKKAAAESKAAEQAAEQKKKTSTNTDEHKYQKQVNGQWEDMTDEEKKKVDEANAANEKYQAAENLKKQREESAASMADINNTQNKLKQYNKTVELTEDDLAKYSTTHKEQYTWVDNLSSIASIDVVCLQRISDEVM